MRKHTAGVSGELTLYQGMHVLMTSRVSLPRPGRRAPSPSQLLGEDTHARQGAAQVPARPAELVSHPGLAPEVGALTTDEKVTLRSRHITSSSTDCLKRYFS